MTTTTTVTTVMLTARAQDVDHAHHPCPVITLPSASVIVPVLMLVVVCLGPTLLNRSGRTQAPQRTDLGDRAQNFARASDLRLVCRVSAGANTPLQLTPERFLLDRFAIRCYKTSRNELDRNI